MNMRAEPPQFWAASIAGIVVGLNKVADFVKPMTGTEATSLFNTIYSYLNKMTSNTMKWIAIIGFSVLLVLIGAAVVISVAH